MSLRQGSETRVHARRLLRNGATLVQARELARHADVRMTMKYTHIGLQDQADALAGLPLPKYAQTLIGRVLAGFRVVSWVRRFQRVTVATTRTMIQKTKKPLRGKGFRHRVSLTFRKCQLT
jgi:uncharacterized protein YfaQ (DUF2300 family)